MRQVVMCVMAAGLVACGSGADEGQAEEVDLPGDYGEIIASEDDCSALQDIFDTAENAAEGQRDSGNADGARSFTAVMDAVDERMREVGC